MKGRLLGILLVLGFVIALAWSGVSALSDGVDHYSHRWRSSALVATHYQPDVAAFLRGLPGASFWRQSSNGRCSYSVVDADGTMVTGFDYWCEADR